MPDLLSHILCAEETIDKIQSNTLKKHIYKKKILFNFGAQGPDIFIYYKGWPWTKKGAAQGLGERMHNEKTGVFLRKGIEYLKAHKNEEAFDDLLVYFSGFLCHFALDKNAHPFIYYYGGVPNGEKNKKYDNYHKKLEIIIDTIMLKEKKNLNAQKYNTPNLIKVKEDYPSILNKFYESLLYEVYNVKLEKNIGYAAWKDMYTVLKLLHDPYGIKKAFIRIFDLIVHDHLKYTNNLYPKEINNNLDYLNLKHDVWLDPCTREQYTKSFIDLYDKAIDDGASMINKVYSYINEEIGKENIKDLFQDISYDTNKPCNSQYKLKYYDCIFE